VDRGGNAGMTAAAARTATTVLRRSDLAEGVVAYGGAVTVGAVVVRDMAFSLGGQTSPRRSGRRRAPDAGRTHEQSGQEDRIQHDQDARSEKPMIPFTATG
jgi:hypothetical protein